MDDCLGGSYSEEIMGLEWLIPFAIVALTVVAMECVAALVHRHIMHGSGWGWHRSHHEPKNGVLEKNDLYALVFAAISFVLFALSARIWPLLWWVGLGMTVYGILYAVLHDGLVHRRFPIGRVPRNQYLKRLIQAHRLHHAVHRKDGAVSFGFLYAPPVRQLRDELRRGNSGS